MKELTTDNGHVYDLTDRAIVRLQEASNARQADDVFAGFASHVPPMDRLAIWTAVDSIQLAN